MILSKFNIYISIVFIYIFHNMVYCTFLLVTYVYSDSNTRPLPVCLYEIGDDFQGTSVVDTLVRNGFAVSSKQ